MVGEHRQKRSPRPDLILVLLRHHSRYLSQMSEVVYNPCGQQLTERHTAQARVFAGEIELRPSELPGLELLEVRSAQSRELGEERLGGAPRVARPVAEPIVRLEAEIGPLGKNDARSRDPIGFLTVDEVPYHVERTERFGTLGASDPRLAETVEQRPQRGGRASQYFDRQIQVEIHRRSPSRHAGFTDDQRQALTMIGITSSFTSQSPAWMAATLHGTLSQRT